MNRRRVRAGLLGAAMIVSSAAAAFATPAFADAAPAKVPGTPCTASAKACVDLQTQKAWLIHNGHVTYGRAMAATGKHNSTPAGNYRVTRKDKNHRSHESHNAPMPYSVFFDHKGRAFHEGNVWQQSDGCVHLTKRSAQTFYGSLKVGDKVQVR